MSATQMTLFWELTDAQTYSGPICKLSRTRLVAMDRLVRDMVPRMLRWIFYCCFGALFAVVLCRPAHAEPLPLTRTLSLGHPRRPVRITLKSGSELAFTAGARQRSLPAESAREVSLEEHTLAPDAAVAIVRVHAENGDWIGLVGGRTGNDLLLFERSDPTGDPGERHHRVILTATLPTRITTGVRFEDVSLCGARAVLLNEQRLDPDTLQLVNDYTLPSAAGFDEAVVTPASHDMPTPRLDALVAVASSERDTLTELPRVPHTLLHAPSTPAPDFFSARAGSFALLRWEGGQLPIEQLELSIASTHAIELWWLGERERVTRATLPASTEPTRFHITPAEPLTGHCLAMYVARIQDTTTPSIDTTATLSNLRAYTSVDRDGGIAQLLGAVVQDDEHGAQAAEVLARLGADVAEQLAARWVELSERGRRRGLKVLARALQREPVRRRVLETARDPDAALSGAAIATLVRGGDDGRAALRTLATEHGTAGDQAARALSQHPETPALLAALAHERGENRPVLRAALSDIAKRDPQHFRAALTIWLPTAPFAARAASALAAVNGTLPALAGSIIEHYAPSAEHFADRYRFALAARNATLSPTVTAWLVSEAREAPEWMQRRAAFEALTHQHTAIASTLARELAADDSPRVRASTPSTLIAAGKRDLVETLARRDPWPLVRAAATQALAVTPDSRPTLEAALGDSAHAVRRAAIDALAMQQHRPAWPAIAHQLTDAHEAREVREAALHFARDVCIQEADSLLLTLATHLNKPDADELTRELAVAALRVLHALGGTAQDRGAELVARIADPALRTLWERLPRARCHAPNAT